MLQRVLSDLPTVVDPNVLVGFEASDDAGVYRLDDDVAVVQSTDFFTPVVDDPYSYGQIAAANSLSDLYAMGATPRFALSIVGFPQGTLDEEILRAVLKGGAQTMVDAGVAIIGGHSVQDPELKFGYAVTGMIHPSKILQNHGVVPGDVLVLTKPIGTGVITTGIKFGKCPQGVADRAIEWMKTLNRDACRVLLEQEEIHAVTDVTGYGLLGHGFEMALSSGVCLEIESSAVPLIDGVEELAAQGMLPGGIRTNQEFIGKAIQWNKTPRALQRILLDPQTSGGLLVGLPADSAPTLLDGLHAAGLFGVAIGRVVNRTTPYLSIL